METANRIRWQFETAALLSVFFMEVHITMEQNLTVGSVWKKLLLFALPIMGANLLRHAARNNICDNNHVRLFDLV